MRGSDAEGAAGLDSAVKARADYLQNTCDCKVTAWGTGMRLIEGSVHFYIILPATHIESMGSRRTHDARCGGNSSSVDERW